MKKLAMCVFVCLCACSSTQKVASTPTNDTYYPPDPTPPFSFPVLTVLDIRNEPVHPVIVAEDEQTKYEESVNRIEKEIREEGLQVQMYAAVYGSNSKEYKAFLKNSCSIDVLLDSRGDHHNKPYCKH
jgi:hypothetical protein